MIDLLTMTSKEGAAPINVKLGQFYPILYEEFVVHMKVIKLYKDGSFDGEVEWEEA